ncbi:MAG: LytS/YhcK type 5TM receptor domain-containing protein [Spirochaetales bacterium]|nr:LytS/YhcK type 5TM receptor domain-containing protein [Spirochaetales bacterium]
MPFETQIIDLLRSLISQGGLILFFAFLLTRLNFLRSLVFSRTFTLKKGLVLVAYFSGIAIMGTYTGIPVMGALANARVVGVFVGGLLGGPIVGIAAGFLAGFHRFAIDLGGFTSLACMSSTVVEGIMAGLLSYSFRKVENKWLFAALWGAVAELVQMAVILLVARPFSSALQLVELIAVPMIFGNAIGIAMFIAIIEDALKEKEKIALKQSHRVLKIVQETMEHLRSGFTPETADAVTQIILKHIKVSAVSLSDRDKCLAFRGKGEDHHKSMAPLQTRVTKDVLADGHSRVVNKREDIGCSHDNCPLSSAVIAPLKVNGETVGTLKLYRAGDRGIGPVDVEVAQGLAALFSTQIEVSELQRQRELLTRAELKALQSQIRPHFLFNALNTISSLIRLKPDKARELMVSLSDLLRRSLKTTDSLIPLEEELFYVRSYLEIEQARFGSKLAVEYHIKVSQDIKIPPLILQPIIENSIKHGIGTNLNNSLIKIEVKKKLSRIQFVLSDTGVGMEQEKIDRILNHEETGNSIGLKNVNDRLEHLYGKGLEISSEPGKGTKVSFSLPQGGE